MSQLDGICQEVVAKVESALACGVIDRATSMLLAAHRVGRRRNVLDEVQAVAIAELFFGTALPQLDPHCPDRGAAGDLLEMHLSLPEHDQFAKSLAGGRALLVLVTERSTKTGMAWAQLKWAVPGVEALLS